MKENNIIITVYKSCTRSNKPSHRHLSEFIKAKITDENHQQLLKQIALISDKKNRDNQKIRKFEAISVHVLENGGGTDNIKSLNPIMMIDIDHVGSTDAILSLHEKIFNRFKDNIIYFSLSISRNGLHYLLHVNPINTKEEYFAKFDYFQSVFRDEFSVEIDHKTRNVVCKLILTCDKDYTIYNENTIPFSIPEEALNTKIKEKGKPVEVAALSHVPIPTQVVEPRMIELLERFMKKIQKKKEISFVATERHKFITSLAGYCNVHGIEMNTAIHGLNYLVGLDKFPEHLESFKDIYLKNPEQFGVAKKRRSNHDKERRNYVQEAKAFILQNYKLEYNTVLGKTEIIERATGISLPLNSWVQNSIWSKIAESGIFISAGEIGRILNSDIAGAYDPFKRFIEGLPSWDGKHYIKRLYDTLGVLYPDDEMAFDFLMRWIIAMVACMYDMKPNHTVLTLAGSQSIGKTSWLKKFILPELGNYFYAGAINPNDKDSKIRLAETCINVMDELESLPRHHIAPLKELVTCSTINERRPFEARSEILQRRASFAATVNSAEFLNDSTGSRRFLIIEVNKCDYEHDVDMRMVYAQAFALYKEGFKYWFDSTEAHEITNSNNRFQETEPLLEYIPRHFRLPIANEVPEKFTSTDVATIIAGSGYPLPITSAFISSTGKALKALFGDARATSKGITRYKLIRIIEDSAPQEVPDEIRIFL